MHYFPLLLSCHEFEIRLCSFFRVLPLVSLGLRASIKFSKMSDHIIDFSARVALHLNLYFCIDHFGSDLFSLHLFMVENWEALQFIFSLDVFYCVNVNLFFLLELCFLLDHLLLDDTIVVLVKEENIFEFVYLLVVVIFKAHLSILQQILNSIPPVYSLVLHTVHTTLEFIFSIFLFVNFMKKLLILTLHHL